MIANPSVAYWFECWSSIK